MTIVRIRQRTGKDVGPFTVGVDFDGGGEYERVVSDPFDPAVERELVWYFEEHLRFPFLDWDRRDAAAKAVTAYGTELFRQVFSGKAHYDYRRLRDGGFDGCRIEVVGSAAFHRLHWEALRDPDLETPLGVRVPVVRRVADLGSRFDLPTARATVNVLVVTARPDGPKDVGYRTISWPLLDALRRAQLPVTVDLVRPGTWPALRRALQAASQRHGTGWYQVVHFDLHGLFGEHAALDRQRRAGRLLFDPGELPPFEGRQAMLFFETAADGVAQPVPARAVASLLAEHRVPVAVLNACQSATQDASEAGLAQHLAGAGVPLAVGMAYSVTVSAAQIAMPELYEQLAAGADPITATHAARRALFDHRGRQAYFDQTIDLEDWILPVVFGQRPFTMVLRAATAEEQTSFYEREAAVGVEPAVRYGFVGRDLDIQAIERCLLLDPERNELLVRGLAGAGKSTLLAHLGWWWQRTGLVERVFTFTYEQRAWTAAHIVREIARQLLTAAEQVAFDSMGEAAQAERIAHLLRARRYLLIIDNAESITASPAAIPHGLPVAERARLGRFLARLRGGHTLVLIGSRQDEAWLADGTFADSIYLLAGLDPQATSQLVERILHAHAATRYRSDPHHRDALTELVKLLGGHPLPLTVVLPALATNTPADILGRLKAGGADADPTGVINRVIEYSHGTLDPAIQHSMLLLAPFTTTIPTEAFLDLYQRLLEATEPVRALGPINLTAAIAEATRVGLTTAHPDLTNMVQVVPVLPYFLRTRLHQRPDLAAAASQAHYELHHYLASDLHEILTGHIPGERAVAQAVAHALYPNLTSALDYALQTCQPLRALVGAIDEYLDQAGQHTTRQQLLDQTITAYPALTSEDQHAELAQLHNLAGHVALIQRRLTDAQHHYQTDLHLTLKSGDEHSIAGTYHQLGRVMEEQRRLDDADQHYRKALDTFLDGGERHRAIGTYHQLGMVAQRQRRFNQADEHYRQAVDIALEFGDRQHAALTLHQLGTVAEEQRRFDDADEHYRNALDIFLEFGDWHNAANTYHHLGAVALEQRLFDKADRHYRQALNIDLEFGDRLSAAKTYCQLGRVMEGLRRFDEATRHYRQALQIELEFDDRNGIAGTYHQLGMVAQAQRRFDEADQHYRQALDIKLEVGDRYSAARTYGQLGLLAQDQRRFDDADGHYRQALDIFLEFGDRYNASLTYHQLGEVLAQAGRHDQSVNALIRAALAWRESTGSWPEATLGLLRVERTHVAANAFEAAIRTGVPDEAVAGLEALLRLHDSASPS